MKIIFQFEKQKLKVLYHRVFVVFILKMQNNSLAKHIINCYGLYLLHVLFSK